MRPKFRTVTVIAVAMLAMSVVGVASASASLPELTNSKGEALLKKHFTLDAGEAKIETSFETYDCKSITSKGEVTGKKTVGNVVVEWHECGNSGNSCSNTGKMLKSETLKGALTYIDKASKTVGLVLEKEKQDEYEELGFESPLWATYECSSVGYTLRGHLIGLLTSVNTYKKAFTLNYAASAKGTQDPNQYEGGPAGEELVTTATGSGKEQKFLLNAGETLTTEEEAEIKA
jgi:hypothetical protein